MSYTSIKISENEELFRSGTNNTIHKVGNNYQMPTIGYGYDIKQSGFNANDLNSKTGTDIATQEQMNLLKNYCEELVKRGDETDQQYATRTSNIKTNYNRLISQISITKSQADTLLANMVSGYETALNEILSEIGISLNDGQKSALISLFYNTCNASTSSMRSVHPSITTTLLPLLSSSKSAESKFIVKLGIWYEILYNSNPSSNGDNRYGIQNRRFIEANEFLGISSSTMPSSSTAKSVIEVTSLTEANIAIAFMNDKYKHMHARLSSVTNYNSNPYDYIQNNFSEAVKKIFSEYNVKYDENNLKTLFTEWNVFTDLKLSLNSENKLSGETEHQNITGSYLKDFIFFTSDDSNLNISGNGGFGDDTYVISKNFKGNIVIDENLTEYEKSIFGTLSGNTDKIIFDELARDDVKFIKNNKYQIISL